MTEHLPAGPTTTLPRKKKSKQITSSNDNSSHPPPSLVERIHEYPPVHKAVENTSQMYSNAKNYNRFTKWSLELAESPVVYVAGKTQDTFGPTLVKIDQFAGEAVGKAGSLYDANRPTISRVITPISNASDQLLTSAERAVDTYLPPLHQTPTGPSSQSRSIYEERGEDENIDDDEEEEEEVVETKYNRSKKLTRTVYDRLRERAWRFLLYVQGLALFILAQAILIGVSLLKRVVRYVVVCVIEVVRAPREAIMKWIEKIFKFVYLTAQLVMYPSRWVEFGVNLIKAVVELLNSRGRRERSSGKEGERVGPYTKKRRIHESKDDLVPYVKFFHEAGQEKESIGTKMD